MTSMYLYGKPVPVPEGAPFTDYIDPSITAVISIDMHDGHLSDDPECPCPAPRAREILEPIDNFHAAARENGVQVIHVRSSLRPSGVDDIKGVPSAWRFLFASYVGGIPNSDQHAIEGTRWTKLCTTVGPGDELVETKRRLSAFYVTDLEFLLHQMGIKTVVLDGGMTDCCILNTAFDAANRNFRVVVPQDLVRGTNDELEDYALRIMSLHTGIVVDSGELVEAWRSSNSSE